MESSELNEKLIEASDIMTHIFDVTDKLYIEQKLDSIPWKLPLSISQNQCENFII